MNTAATVAYDVGGVLMVIATGSSVATTLVIPRSHVSPVFKFVDRIVDSGFRGVCKWFRYEVRDRFLAGEAPVVILALLLVWLWCFTVAFALILAPIEPNFVASMRQAASDMFTLGFLTRTGASPTFVDFCAASTGIITIALQIGYLPVLYGSYNRRETEVTLLGLRAGTPPWGPELITRAARFGTFGEMPAFYESWERWSADVTESHSSYPVLLRFRSPHGQTSWVVGLLAVLDSAALVLALAPSQAALQVRLCMRAGFLCMRRVAATIGIPVDDDPSPDSPIELTFDEFASAYELIVAAGFPVERSAEDAWPHFKGWRVNYESAAYGLAKETDAVPALWSGPRRTCETAVSPALVIDRVPENAAG